MATQTAAISAGADAARLSNTTGHWAGRHPDHPRRTLHPKGGWREPDEAHTNSTPPQNMIKSPPSSRTTARTTPTPGPPASPAALDPGGRWDKHAASQHERMRGAAGHEQKEHGSGERLAPARPPG
jgi:hypothetical protein